MKDLLIQQGVHNMLHGKLKKHEYMINKMFEEMNEKVASAIHLSLFNKVMYNLNLIDKAIIKYIYNSLKWLYILKNLSKKL